MANNRNIAILGKGGIDQMRTALDILMDMSLSENSFVFTHEIIDEWRRQVLEMTPTAIDIDVANLQMPSNITSITITTDKILLSPGFLSDDDEIENAIAVFAWITDGDTQTTIPPSANLKHPPIEIVYPKDKTTELYFSNKFSRDARDESGNLIEWRIPIKMKGGTEAYSTAMVENADLDGMAQRSALSLSSPPPEVQIATPLTREHEDIFKLICSYASAGQMEFTDAGLCKFSYSANTPEQRDRINELIEDMMSDRIIIDTGTMGDYYNFTRRRIKENVLPISIVEDQTVNIHGTFTSRRYILKDKPILLQWAEWLNQIARCSRELLDTPINKSPLIISLHLYLADRLIAIPRLSNKILYNTIYEHLNINGNDQSSRNKRSEIRTKTRIILNTWKSKKYIKGWHEETKDRQKITVSNDGKVKRGVQSYCIVIEGIPKLAARS